MKLTKGKISKAHKKKNQTMKKYKKKNGKKRNSIKDKTLRKKKGNNLLKSTLKNYGLLGGDNGDKYKLKDGVDTSVEGFNSKPDNFEKVDNIDDATYIEVNGMMFPKDSTETQEFLKPPPVENQEAPPVENQEAPPVESQEAPPVENQEAPPVENQEAPPVENQEAPLDEPRENSRFNPEEFNEEGGIDVPSEQAEYGEQEEENENNKEPQCENNMMKNAPQPLSQSAPIDEDTQKALDSLNYLADFLSRHHNLQYDGLGTTKDAIKKFAETVEQK
jgi:hypothetical protein